MSAERSPDVRRSPPENNFGGSSPDPRGTGRSPRVSARIRAEPRRKVLRRANCRGYWLGGRTSAADSRESARIRADSARFRADPPDVRQKCFSADSAERPANVRRTPADSARIRADPRGLRGELAEEFTR